MKLKSLWVETQPPAFGPVSPLAPPHLQGGRDRAPFQGSADKCKSSGVQMGKKHGIFKTDN